MQDLQKLKLTIIIVSWNVRDKLRDNLKAIKESDAEFLFETIVIDNNSADGTAQMVEREFPWVKIIANDDNLGFAKANNQGIRIAEGEYLLLLNPDMKVNPHTLRKMTTWMDANEQATVASCHLKTESGETIKHVRRFPKFFDQLAIVLKLPHIFSGILKSYIREDFDYTEASKVDSARGGFFMIRHRVLRPSNKFLVDIFKKANQEKKTGLTVPELDERYFIWFEEVDYCKQIEKIGGQAWYTPVAECTDFVGQSFKQVASHKKQKYFRDSMLKYFKKWHPSWQFTMLKIAWLFSFFMVLIADKLNYKSKAKT